ncbi:MAG: hypothetical protein H0W33_09445 [Gammaproteobacteria bacterium]|nr:hypothetical protein [Gammaproteobacteria bacterium]
MQGSASANSTAKPRAWAARLSLLAVFGLGVADTFAVETLRLEIGDLQAAFGSAEGVVLLLEPTRDGPPAVSLAVEAVALPEPIGRLTDIRIDCAALVTGDERLACSNAHVVLKGLLGRQDVRADVTYDTGNGRLEIHLVGVAFAQARLDIDLQGTPDDWAVAVRGRGLNAATIGALIGELGLLDELPEIGGRLNVELQARGDGGGLEQVDAQIDAQSLSGSDASGRLAVESLALALDLGLSARDGGWGFDVQARSDSGQLYLEPWFVEPGAAQLELTARGVYTGSVLELDAWSLCQEAVLTASGSARVALEPEIAVESANLNIAGAQFPDAYRIYLQPYLYGGALDALETSGRLEGEIALAQNGLQRIALTAHDMHIDDTNERFAIYGLNGAIHWSDQQQAELTRLSWHGGFVYGIGFGPTKLAAEIGGQRFRLLEPLVLPVLDGRLLVRELAVRNFGTPGIEVGFDAELEPLDMRALTAALGWPSFSGQLSGRIPDLSYADGVVMLGGDLTAEVFNGEITVENLQLRDPFGGLPQLAADARLRGLDLESVTDTFEIGRIEGGLDGDVERLRLFRWMPVAFDARVYTPPEDELRHRISQRAVESISSLGGGGGAAAALSSGFLQFFESFAYARLGLGCRLENEVCHMQGIAPAPEGGYYIVEGKWLPRIDVIGHAEHVDWPVLLEQLRSLANADDVVVR